MTKTELLTQVLAAKTAFGPGCSKFAGAITAEFIRQALKAHGVPVSRRDVFIRGIPIELDLVIPKAGVVGELDLLYEPADVGAVIEVKANGIIGRPALDRVRGSFVTIQGANPQIRCAYVALAERRGYRWAATDETLNAPAFNLFLYSGSRVTTAEPTGQWQRLIDFASQASKLDRSTR